MNSNLLKNILFLNFIINLSVIAIRFHNDTINKRHRRYLLTFQGGGVNKMAFGATYPVNLGDRIKWRQLNCAYNIQPQFPVPTAPIYPWDRWDEGRGANSNPKKLNNNNNNNNNDNNYNENYQPDESRKLIYIALETYMNYRGKKGRKCLLRAICENAQIDDHHGIFSEILHSILTPGNLINEEYRDAYEAGMSGVDCFHLFSECLKGDSFLDEITVLL